MNSMKKKREGYTYVRYVLSYLLVITVLILGFFFIIKTQLTRRFFSERTEQIQMQMDNVSEWLGSDFLHLIQVDSSLSESLRQITLRYKKKSVRMKYAYEEMHQYDSNIRMINCVVYKPRNSDEVINTKYNVTYYDDVFHITNVDLKTVEFNPAPYLGFDTGQLIIVSNEAVKYLLYFPSTKTLDDDICFFMLDIADIQQMLRSIMTDELTAITLMDEDKQIVAGVNDELLMPYMDSFALSRGIYPLDSDNSVCVKTGVYNGFSLVALVSQEALSSQVDAAFSSSYLALMLLCVVALLLMLFSMRITYTPLQRLTRKLLPDATHSRNYLEQLDSVFSKTEKQNQMLTEKLDGYRHFMQKSLLDSLVSSHPQGETTVSPNIDQFFDKNSNKEIFVIQMMCPDKPLPCYEIQAYFQEVLPGNDSCMILEAKPKSATFLINYTGMEMNKDEVLKELLNSYYEEKGYLSAISTGTDSPLDIPSAYENVMRAGRCWPKVPVVACSLPDPSETAFTYPYRELHQLSQALKDKSFVDAKVLTGDIFRIIDNSVQAGNNLPNFFVCSILIDMLTVIANCMNTANIRFEFYESLYSETLFFCRSCSYVKKAGKIQTNIYSLIDVYEQEISNMAISAEQIMQLMEEAYTQPDFSITLLASKYHVSIAYMSYLMQKKLNQSFSDCLWALRFKKAAELLNNSDMPIDEISVAVGYLNPSSFRRKFKQETGLTPLQFRKRKEE